MVFLAKLAPHLWRHIDRGWMSIRDNVQGSPVSGQGRLDFITSGLLDSYLLCRWLWEKAREQGTWGPSLALSSLGNQKKLPTTEEGMLDRTWWARAMVSAPFWVHSLLLCWEAGSTATSLPTGSPASRKYLSFSTHLINISLILFHFSLQTVHEIVLFPL